MPSKVGPGSGPSSVAGDVSHSEGRGGRDGVDMRAVAATLMPLAGPGSTVIDPWSPSTKPREVGEVVEVVVAESMEPPVRR